MSCNDSIFLEKRVKSSCMSRLHNEMKQIHYEEQKLSSLQKAGKLSVTLS